MKLIKNEINTNFSDTELVMLRDQFAKQYTNEKGWDITNLSFEQIAEIRSNPQWKNPHLMLS